MGTAPMRYTEKGQVAWDEMWTDFCDLALAGGPPHRDTLLEPVPPDEVKADMESYERVLSEIERGWRLVTGLPTVRSEKLGWIGLQCQDEEMALWILRAIVVENVCVRREGNSTLSSSWTSLSHRQGDQERHHCSCQNTSLLD